MLMVRFIRFGKLFRLYEFIQPFLKYSLPLEDTLPGQKVLVVAPHPDDEAIGCGGTIVRHVAAGGTVETVVCTMDNERKKEAVAAATVLGVKNTVFLDYEIESLAHQKTLAERLLQVFTTTKPDIIFVPFWFDNHTDHRAVNDALITIAGEQKIDAMIYAYPVWFPLYPNVLVDIGPVWESKKKAIECYPSQLATRDYVAMSRSLGQYWAKVKGRGLDVVETFFRASFSEYVSLGKKIYSR
jgi:LmbE family N-acetylglucosaminyl deacetylase